MLLEDAPQTLKVEREKNILGVLCPLTREKDFVVTMDYRDPMDISF